MLGDHQRWDAQSSPYISYFRELRTDLRRSPVTEWDISALETTMRTGVVMKVIQSCWVAMEGAA